MAWRAPETVSLGIVLVLAALFRVPALLNAGGINSDAAIVGLQGRHILEGEWAWRLWGTDYQGALDSALAALSFFLLGPSPRALIAVPFVGLLVMVVLAFDVLRRRVGPYAAACAVMPLVFAPMASNLPMLYVMRQSLATTLMLGVWLADGASRSSRPRIRLVSAGLVFALGLYVDAFALVVLPAAAVFLLDCALEPHEAGAGAERSSERLVSRRALAIVAIAGFVAAAVLLLTGVVPIRRVVSNFRLLLDTCLPFALGTKVFVKGQALVAQPWSAPWPVMVLQTVGALLFALSLLSPALFVFSSRVPGFDEDVPREVRRLGLLGLGTTALVIAAFLVSTKPVDMWSSRYLAPIFWLSPLSLAPLAYVLGARRLAIAHAPYWATALIGGWLSYGVYVDGPTTRLHPSAAMSDERILEDELVGAGIHHAEAQYWLAYRLSFLFEEDPIVVPLDRAQDRYPPHRARVDAAPVRALVFHPSEPRADASVFEAELRAAGQAYERREVAGFTVLVVRR